MTVKRSKEVVDFIIDRSFFMLPNSDTAKRKPEKEEHDII